MLLLASGSAQAQARRAGPSPGELCREPEYRQLDHSIGRFGVEPILACCALRGHWRGAIDGSGAATTWYDRHGGQWHRDFVNDDGRNWETLLASIAIPER